MIVTFKSDVAKRKRFFTPESFAHPAKMHLGMLLWIVGRYTKLGETILDPMAGAGSTMLATRYGRNVILVELEQKFVDMAGANWDKVKTLPKTKFGLGTCQIIQGDARQLEGLLVDKIITSPPYTGMNKNEPVADRNRQVIRSKQERISDYAPSKDNLGNLPYGQIDKIVTSPPYEATFNEKQHTLSGIAKRDPKMRREVGGYSGDKRVDSIITSPPYEGAISGKDEQAREREVQYVEAHGRKVSPHSVETMPSEYSGQRNNIGNLKSTSYLSAMLQVYQQCYKVLKPNGLMILVTKDFIRNKQRVLLSIDTLKLCERVGFVLEDWHERKLTQQSFWRILYYKKNPLVERLLTEDILVFRKS